MPGLGHDVRDRVAHAEVRGHRAVEHPLEHGEHVGGRAADVHADHRRSPSRCAIVSMMSPTAPGVGMIGTGVQVMSFL